MRSRGQLRGVEPNIEVYHRGTRRWYPLDECDMGHTRDAVAYWNRSGFQHGPRSPQARAWMRNPDNYMLEPSSINRSRGAGLGLRYRPPAI